MARKKAQPVPAYPEELEGENNGEDWISRLPDEIIALILSLLTVQEAMVTSVLSRRWRHMWTFMSCLDFDAQKKFDSMDLYQTALDACGYRRWVNRVLESHQVDTVDRLRIRFDFSRMETPDVYSWIHYAIEKRVTSLEMDFSTYLGSPQYCKLLCSLPHLPSHPPGFPGYEYLKDLKLSSIDVTGDFLEYFLSVCPLLERVSVVASNSLVKLNVVGPLPYLKYLTISGCNNVENVEISAENLLSLKYSGPNINLPLKSIPLLAELFVGGDYCKFFVDNILQFSDTLFRIESLGLDMHGIQKTTDFFHVPFLKHLKQLEVKLDARVEESLLGLTSLIKASPFLQKFTLWLYCPYEGHRDIQKVEKCPHNNLKVVEFYGFIGCAIDLELANYFIDNAKALEKIIVDRRNPYVMGRARQFKEDRKKISARKHARLLRKKIPRGGPTIVIH